MYSFSLQPYSSQDTMRDSFFQSIQTPIQSDDAFIILKSSNSNIEQFYDQNANQQLSDQPKKMNQKFKTNTVEPLSGESDHFDKSIIQKNVQTSQNFYQETNNIILTATRQLFYKNKKNYQTILTELNKNIISFPFRFPVDPIADGVPDYYEIIRKPMDLQTIGLKVKRGKYNSCEEFSEDIEQIVKNSKYYHQNNSQFFEITSQFQSLFSKLKNKYLSEKKKSKKGRPKNAEKTKTIVKNKQLSKNFQKQNKNTCSQQEQEESQIPQYSFREATYEGINQQEELFDQQSESNVVGFTEKQRRNIYFQEEKPSNSTEILDFVDIGEFITL